MSSAKGVMGIFQLEVFGGVSPLLSARSSVIFRFACFAKVLLSNLFQEASQIECIWRGVPSVSKTVSEYIMCFQIRRH